MSEMAAQLGPDYIIQFSFAVLYALLTFSSTWDSVSFLFLLGFLLLLAFGAPRAAVAVGGAIGRWMQDLWGNNIVPLFPFPLRILLAGAVVFVVMYRLSSDIGIVHACQLLQGTSGLPSVVQPQFFAKRGENSWDANLKHLQEHLNKSSNNNESEKVDTTRLVQLWRTEDTLYLGTQVRVCESRGVVFKVLTKHVPVVRHITSGS